MANGEDMLRIGKKRTTEIRAWASIWGDLLHSDMVLLARDQTPDGSSAVFARRALWEGAVIAYGRTDTDGRRARRVGEVLGEMDAEAIGIHEEVMAWRHHHIAHRVEPSREQVQVWLRRDRASRSMVGIGVSVSPVLAPEEEGDLAVRFAAHVKRLRDLVWETRIQPLADHLEAELSRDEQAIRRLAIVALNPERRFAINLRLLSARRLDDPATSR